MRGIKVKISLIFMLVIVGVLFLCPQRSYAESVTSVVTSGGQDAYVRFMMPNNNFGGEANLWAGGATASDPRLHAFFVQFQLPSLPAGATIDSASAQFYFYEEVIIANDLELQAAAANANWDENTITWNNKPGTGATETASLVQAGVFGWKTFDLTSLVKRWYAGSQANHGIEIFNPGESNVVKRFYSGQSGTGLEPRLVVNYTVSTNPINPGGNSNNNQTSNTQGTQGVSNQNGTNQTGTTGTNPADVSTAEKVAGYIAEETTNAISLAKLTAREIAKSATSTVLIIAAAALTAASALASIFSVLLSQVSLKELFLIIFNYFVSLLNFKKRNKFGLVYDQVSNTPITAAIVRLFDFKTMKMLDSTLTDTKGHFFFTVNPGEYAITVTKTGFIFPSRSISKSEKFVGGAYIGQTIRILNDASVINVKIPLDRTIKAKIGRSILVNLLLSDLIRYVIMIVGSAVTLYVLYNDYSRMYLFIACLYLLLWIIELAVQNRDLKFNRVMDQASKQPIDLATIRVFNTSGRLIQTCVSDFKGRFIAKTAEGGDKINIERVGYQTLERKTQDAGLLEGKRFYLSKA